MRCNYLFVVWAAVCLPACVSAADPPGIFEDHTDVGSVLHAGAVAYDAVKRTYTVSGSGENMWFRTDAFQFAWRKVSGDVTLTADIAFAGAGSEAHRKAVLMVRQSLDADSPYADVARHGDGLTSLQARDEQGAITSEIQSNVKAPARVRIVKRGDWFYMWVAGEGGELEFAGGSIRVPLHDPFYVGIAVCSHNKDTVETAVFANVALTTPGPQNKQAQLYSTLETVPMSGDRRVTYVSPGRLTEPTWTPDGTGIVFHREDHVERVPLAGGHPERKFVITYSGPPLVDPKPLDEHAMQKLPADGFENRDAYASPDGEQIAFVSFAKDTAGIPENQEVLLRVLSVKDGQVKVLAKFVGGKGSMDAPCWSPDGKRIAFVSYQWIE